MAVDTEDTEFKLNSQRIIQIISDPAFYAKCVAFLYLQDLAHARWMAYETELIRVHTNCSGCQDNSRAIIGPAIAEFVRQITRLQAAGPQLLDPLREYLVAKLGYRPSAFVLYYKESGCRKELTF